MSNQDKENYINRREQIGGFLYVLLFFTIGTALCCWLLLAQSDMAHIFSRKDLVNTKMHRQNVFKEEQAASLENCQIIVQRIKNYDPGVNAVYEKNDIQFMINELRKIGEYNRSDRRYMVYIHLGDFYQMWFNDKQYLWSLESNIRYLKKNLEDCELGLSKKKEEAKSGQ